jgi:hypothetical protein
MNERISEVMESYKNSLERKQNMIKRIQKKKFEMDLQINEEINLARLEAETQLLITLIEDLEYIQKG